MSGVWRDQAKQIIESKVLIEESLVKALAHLLARLLMTRGLPLYQRVGRTLSGGGRKSVRYSAN
jgi:hypothetical protein